jgi:hypothetical protein
MDIAYTKEQITQIKQVMAKSMGTVEALPTIPPEYRDDLLPGFTQEVSHDISDCIRLLETGYRYV